MTPVRLFVGCAAGFDAESQAVLEYTARRFTTGPLEITWMHQQPKGIWSGWNTSRWKTPFTGYRWGVPAACDFAGRAIYTDSDFIFRADLADLFEQDIPDVALVRNATGKLSTSCILFNCRAAKAHLPAIDTLKSMPDAHGTLLNYFRGHTHLLAPFEGDWDCADLNGYTDLDDPRIKAIHYTRMETQVSHKHALPRLAAAGKSHWYTGPVGPHWRPELQALFDAELAAATASGYGVDRYLTDVETLGRSNFTYTHSKVRT